MGRRVAVFQTGGGSSGGGTPTIGNLEWGPNFGEAQELTAGVNADISAIDLISTKTCGCNVDLEKVDIVFPLFKTCGCNVDLEKVDVSYSNPVLKAVGCNIDLEKVDVTYDMSKVIGCNIDLFAVDTVYEKTAGVHLSGTVLGAPFWQAIATTTSGGFSSFTVNLPSGIVSGQLLLMFVGTNSAVTGSDINTPSGWTSIRHDTITQMHSRSFWRIADGTEGATITVTTATLVDRFEAEVHRIIATDPTTPINANAGATTAATSLVPDPVSPAVTTTVANCLVFAWLNHNHLLLSQTHTAPASHIELTDFESSGTGNTISSTSDTRVFSAAASTGTATHNCTETVSTDAIQQRIAIAPGALTIAS